MPTEVGIIHCRGDQAASDLISQGKNATDREAKQASLLSLAQQFIVIPNIQPLYLPEEKKHDYYKREPNHKETGQKQGLYVLPRFHSTQILRNIHQALHIGTKPLYHLLRLFIT